MKKPSITLRPRHAIDMFAEAWEEKRLLGRPSTPEEEAVLQRIRQKTRVAITSMVLQAFVAAGILACVSVIASLPSTRPSAPAVSPVSPKASEPSPELVDRLREQEEERELKREIEKEREKSRRLQDITRMQLEQSDMAMRYMNLNRMNAMLMGPWSLFDGELLKRIESLEEKGYDVTLEYRILKFFLQHGKPEVYGKDGKKQPAELSNELDFVISLVEPGAEKTSPHRPLRHYIPYFDEASRTFFLPPLRGAGEENKFEASDVWFALHDAMTAKKTGRVNLSPNPIPRVIEETRLLFFGDATLLHNRINERKPRTVAELVSILREAAEDFVNEAYEDYKVKAPVGKEATTLAIEGHMYRFARFLLLSPLAGSKAKLPKEELAPETRNLLEQIVRNPSVLSI